MANFVFKKQLFDYRGNKDQSRVNFIHAVQMHDLENCNAWCKTFRYIAELLDILCEDSQIFVTMATRVDVG